MMEPSAMKLWPAERAAAIAIGVLLLALVRSLGEYFRLKYLDGQALTIAKVEPLMIGSLAAAVCIGLAFALYATRKYKAAIVVCCAAVGGLLIYKILIFR